MSPLRRWTLSCLVLLLLAAGLWASVAAEQATMLAKRAEDEMQAGDLDASMTDLGSALRWQPHDPALWRQQSVSLGRLGFFRRDEVARKGAVTAARTALSNGGNDGRNAFVLGWALNDAGRPAEAVDAFQIATRLDPYNQSYLYALGLARELAGQRSEAVRAYRAAWAVMPDSAIRDGLTRLGASP